MMGPMRSRPQDDARRMALRQMAQGRPQGGGAGDVLGAVAPLVGAGIGAAVGGPAGATTGATLARSGLSMAQSAMAGDPAGMVGAGLQGGMAAMNASGQPTEDELMDMIAKKRAMMRG